MPAVLKSRIPQIINEIVPVLHEGVHEGAEGVMELAKELVPVSDSPPHLRDAIHLEQIEPATWAVVYGDEEQFYGHFIEFGTQGGAVGPQPARPFAIPSLELQKAAILAGIVARLQRL